MARKRKNSAAKQRRAKSARAAPTSPAKRPPPPQLRRPAPPAAPADAIFDEDPTAGEVATEAIAADVDAEDDSQYNGEEGDVPIFPRSSLMTKILDRAHSIARGVRRRS